MTPSSGSHSASTPSPSSDGMSFYMANFVGTVESSSYSRSGLGYFVEDFWPIFFMCLLSVSNGYVASLKMMNAPGQAPDGEQSRAGTNMAFFLVMGISGRRFQLPCPCPGLRLQSVLWLNAFRRRRTSQGRHTV